MDTTLCGASVPLLLHMCHPYPCAQAHQCTSRDRECKECQRGDRHQCVQLGALSDSWRATVHWPEREAHQCTESASACGGHQCTGRDPDVRSASAFGCH
eukprot:7939862-Alexandrium_andersonii.AAC.1